MKRRPTRSDVALKAGVSKTTVTFVLAGRDDIAIPETTRERVRRAAEELGYRPSAIAQALASGKTSAVTVAFPNLFVPHYGRVLRAIEEHTNAAGYHLVASTMGHVGSSKDAIPDFWTILNSPTDGVILVDMPDTIKPYIAEMASRKPLVAVTTSDVPNVDCVEIGLKNGAQAVLDHLLASRPGRVAFFGFGSADEADGVIRRAEHPGGDARAQVYLRAMAETGRPVEVIHGSHAGRKARIDLLRSYIERNGCPEAIYCYDDESAISAHHCLRRMGLRLPDDVMLTGYDGNEECEYLDPPLTTVVQPVDEICSAAWRFMIQRLENEACDRQYIKLEVELAIRASSVKDRSRLASVA